MEILLEYLAKGFLMMLAISMPCVLVAAGIGLVVGFLQAVTQVQEQTIAAAPKILGVFLVIIIGGVGFIRLLTNFFQEGMVLAFQHVPQTQDFVLEPDFHQYTTPFEYEMKDRFRNIDKIDDIMKNPGKVPYIDNYKRERYTPAAKTASPRPNQVEAIRILGR